MNHFNEYLQPANSTGLGIGLNNFNNINYLKNSNNLVGTNSVGFPSCINNMTTNTNSYTNNYFPGNTKNIENQNSNFNNLNNNSQAVVQMK